MRPAYLPLLLILTIVSCGQFDDNQVDKMAELPEATQPVDSSVIAIIPFEQSIEWLFGKKFSPAHLTVDELNKIEKLLLDCVNGFNRKVSSANREYLSIDLVGGGYKRQYVAAINGKGEKEVWVNCLCRESGNTWKTSIIMVDDGGSCYFNLKINLTKGKYYDFVVNGYA